MEDKNLKILIVDDEVMLNSMYRAKFQKEWFDVQVANDWLEAYTEILDFQPDVVLLDIMMPNMDWFETLNLFNQEPTFNAKVLVLSNINNWSYIEKAKALWACEYLVKSNCTPQYVVDKVKELV